MTSVNLSETNHQASYWPGAGRFRPLDERSCRLDRAFLKSKGESMKKSVVNAVIVICIAALPGGAQAQGFKKLRGEE